MTEFTDLKILHDRGSRKIIEVKNSQNQIFIKKQYYDDYSNIDEEYKNNLLSEINILTKIKSENIINIIDYDIETNNPYYIMPKADQTLEEYLEEKHGLSEIDLFEQICKGIRDLHDFGYVHLDLKPKNILIFKNKEKVISKISDFGLALSIEEIKELSTEISHYGTIGNIPSRDYEDIRQADFSSDIFNLGRILFQMLTGEEFSKYYDFKDELDYFGVIIERANFQDNNPYYRKIKQFMFELEEAKKCQKLRDNGIIKVC